MLTFESVFELCEPFGFDKYAPACIAIQTEFQE